MCAHDLPCPGPDGPRATAALPVAWHPMEGWHLLCNGVLIGDDPVRTDAPFENWRWIPPTTVRSGSAASHSDA